MEKIIVPGNRLIDGERVSKPVEKKLNEVIDWINEHDEKMEDARKAMMEQFDEKH